jgi:hypothetical protein
MAQDGRHQISSGNSRGGKGSGEQGPPTSAVAIVLTLIAAASIAGYFLLMKLIDVSREDDCLLAHRRDCASVEVPINQ